MAFLKTFTNWFYLIVMYYGFTRHWICHHTCININTTVAFHLDSGKCMYGSISADTCTCMFSPVCHFHVHVTVGLNVVHTCTHVFPIPQGWHNHTLQLANSLPETVRPMNDYMCSVSALGVCMPLRCVGLSVHGKYM